MSWTYSGDPSISNKDQVRFLVGDTDSSEPLATDEEIEFALTQNSNVYAAAAFIADGISTYFMRCADSEEIGPVKVAYTSRVQFYSKRAADLLSKVGQYAQLTIYGGGIDIGDKTATDSDTSLVAPNFRIGMNDFASSVTE